MMINMQTLTDKSTSHVAEMLVLGSTMGVVDATKKVKRYRDEAEEDIVNLMDRLLEFEERCIQELKSFL